MHVEKITSILVRIVSITETHENEQKEKQKKKNSEIATILIEREFLLMITVRPPNTNN